MKKRLFLNISLSVATTLSLAALFGIQLTAISAAAPIIVTTLAISDSIHFLMTMFALIRSNTDKYKAILETMIIYFKAL